MEFLKNKKIKNNKKEINHEKDFVKKSEKIHNCSAIKLILFSLNGFPDRTVLCPGGRILFIEFKRSSKEKLTPNQDDWKTTLEGFGFTYRVAWSCDMALTILEEFLNDTDPTRAVEIS